MSGTGAKAAQRWNIEGLVALRATWALHPMDLMQGRITFGENTRAVCALIEWIHGRMKVAIAQVLTQKKYFRGSN